MVRQSDALGYEVSGFRTPSERWDEPVARSGDVAIYEQFRKDENGDPTARGFDVYSPTVHAHTDSKRRAYLTAALVERFGVDLTESREPDSDMSLLRPGVPVVIAAAGKPETATWLFVRGWEVSGVAVELDVSEPTVERYFSRVRAPTGFGRGSE